MPAEQEQATGRDVAREAFIASAVHQAVYLGIMAAVMVAVARRDEIRGLWLRARRTVTNQDTAESHDREVAVFRRQISEWEHQEAGR